MAHMSHRGRNVLLHTFVTEGLTAKGHYPNLSHSQEDIPVVFISEIVLVDKYNMVLLWSSQSLVLFVTKHFE